MKKEWLSLAELAAEKLSDMPTTRQAYAARADREGWDKTNLVRMRKGRGAGKEYHYSLLPDAAQVELAQRYGRKRIKANDNTTIAKPDWREDASGNAWKMYDAAPNKHKEIAQMRLRALNRYDEIYAQAGAAPAIKAVISEYDISDQTLRNWLAIRRRTNRNDLLPALLPEKRGGGGREVEIQGEVWDFIRGDYLRLGEPSFKSCFRRLERACLANGWALPNARTLERRIDSIPEVVKVLARQGEEAARRLYPAQKRDRSMFHAMQAVNADGHKWDVLCHLEDGTVFRPVTLAFQDLYSGKFVGWRHGTGENKDMVRLAFGDMCMSFGIPDMCYLDNGRAFASKWLTGGTPNRYRFKVKPEEPQGILTALGVEIHWTTPYHGQSKPIERGFGDFARNIADGPWFEGAYTGNSPMNKPANYGSRTIPFEEFKRVIDHEIMMHNAQAGRTSGVCGGKMSFNEAFDASRAKSLIRQATPDQLRLCLLAAEGVKSQARDGSINLMGNRYWHQALVNERGAMLTVRFDPDNLHTDLPVYRRDGTLICIARLQEAAGFADTAAAREHAKARNAYIRATREQLAAEKKLTPKDVVKLMGKSGEVMPEPKKIAARAPVIDNLARDIANEDAAENEFFESLRASLKIVPGKNSPGFDD